MKNGLLVLPCMILAIGTCGGPLLTRLYYKNGGQRIWFMSFLSTAGFPFILIPLGSSCLLPPPQKPQQLRKHRKKTEIFLMETPMIMASIFIGLLIGLDNYCFAYGLAYLPVSTMSLIVGTQLGFNAIFSFFMVKQTFTPFSINAIVLLTTGTGILALCGGGDRAGDVSHEEYVVVFLVTLTAAVLYAFILPFVELTYNKVRQEITFTLVLEMQMVMCIAASCFCIVGMLVEGDFKPIGVVFCASSLASGVLISALLPVTEVLAVVCLREKFQAEKGVALLLSLWGFVSYFYGEYKSGKRIIDKTRLQEIELPPLPVSVSRSFTFYYV
ncbi:hypothetical protein Bca52824_032430 [Brassica carinata]|uniref:Probable purine permease n=1 Tax=Brassica carinata TaxID=52824 RepID=A0A8X7V672_BRACI|nr:hypothetical protein Bca52824_032430 [Brassica carinata]